MTDNNQQKRKKLLAEFSMLFLLIAILYGVYWFGWGRFRQYTDDAYVNGNIVQLMPQTSGTVTVINTDDTQLVTAGAALVQLDEADAKIQFENAKAALALTVRQVGQLYENAAQAKAEVSLREADLLKAQLDVQRRKGLIGNRAISAEEMQHVTTALKAAQDHFDFASHRLSGALALVNNTSLYSHPMVKKAEEALKKAYLNYQRTTIYAPVTGYIAKRNVQVGQQVSPRTVLLAIVPLNQIWVDANYKESQLAHLRIGQPVELVSDVDDSIIYHGKIVGLSAGTGNAFALLPPQNATGNWIKIVQRLPVRVGLFPDEIKKHPLRLGLSMRVTSYTKNRGGVVLATQPSTQTLYSTRVYDNQLARADELIKEILTANSPDMAFTIGSST